MICQDIFDVFSETADQNSTKLVRKQDLNVLYQVCVFWADEKKNKQDSHPGLWLALTFSTSPLKLLNGIRRTWQEAIYQRPLSSLRFRADRKNKMATLAWLAGKISTPLWIRWTELNETWQEARSLRPLPSLCFSGRSEKQYICPGLLLAETFSISTLGLEWNSRKPDRRQGLKVHRRTLCGP